MKQTELTRQIKFRVWDKRRNMFADKEHERDYIAISLGLHSDLCVPKEEMVLQQWTGVKDIYGIEIYEGDIIGEDGYIIIFKYGAFGYNIPGYVDNFVQLNELNDNFIKVIGNIFEGIHK